MLQTIWNIIISPFGLVRFRHFFFADILCSMIIPLKDIGFIFCYFTKGGWINSSPPSVDECTGLEYYVFAVAFVPFWLRLAQCIRRYHDCKLKVHLFNAMKYFCSILVNFAFIYRIKQNDDLSYFTFVVISFISCFFSYAWDIYMDWGLFRSHSADKKYLR